MVQDVLIFESDAFSLDPASDERGHQFDLPLGLDLAAHLRERLQAAGTAWDVSEPIIEDCGTVLAVNTAKCPVTTFVFVRWVPIGADDGCWAVDFQQAEGCLRSLFRFLLGGRMAPVTLDRVKVTVVEAVRADPGRFSRPRWLTNDEFRRAEYGKARKRSERKGSG